MKRLLLILFISLPILAEAQSDTAISFSQVNTVDKSSKDELFSRAHTWFNTTFRSAKDVLQITDREAGHLAGKGKGIMMYEQKAALGMKQTIKTMLTFNIDVWVKDGKYKYLISNIDAEDQSAAQFHYGILTSSEDMPIRIPMASQKKQNEMWARLKEEASIYMNGISRTLETSMSAKDSAGDF